MIDELITVFVVKADVIVPCITLYESSQVFNLVCINIVEDCINIFAGIP